MDKPATFLELPVLSPSVFEGKLPIVRQESDLGLEIEALSYE